MSKLCYSCSPKCCLFGLLYWPIEHISHYNRPVLVGSCSKCTSRYVICRDNALWKKCWKKSMEWLCNRALSLSYISQSISITYQNSNIECTIEGQSSWKDLWNDNCNWSGHVLRAFLYQIRIHFGLHIIKLNGKLSASAKWSAGKNKWFCVKYNGSY